MKRPEFTKQTQQDALVRQQLKCASCSERISSLGQMGKQSHKYGEGAHAHHMKHAQQGGTNKLSNCVIICESCHYSIHGGGDYRNKDKSFTGKESDFQFFRG